MLHFKGVGANLTSKWSKKWKIKWTWRRFKSSFYLMVILKLHSWRILIFAFIIRQSILKKMDFRALRFHLYTFRKVKAGFSCRCSDKDWSELFKLLERMRKVEGLLVTDAIRKWSTHMESDCGLGFVASRNTGTD